MSRQSPTRVLLSILPALWVVGACGGVSTSTNDPFIADPGARNEIQVRVINSNFYDARVYVLAQGVRRQLGTVTGKSDRTFIMPWTFSQDLRMEINMLAGETCTSDSLPVDPGDMLQLQIMPEFSSSDFCRYPAGRNE